MTASNALSPIDSAIISLVLKHTNEQNFIKRRTAARFT